MLTVEPTALHLGVQFFSPAGKTRTGDCVWGGHASSSCWLFFVATIFKQSRHTGSSVLMFPPCSLGLKPKYSHTGAVAFGFALHESHLLRSVCVLAAPPPPTGTKILNDWQDGSLLSFHYAKPQTRLGAETDVQSEPSCHPACLEARDEENLLQSMRKTNTRMHIAIYRGRKSDRLHFYLSCD